MCYSFLRHGFLRKRSSSRSLTRQTPPRRRANLKLEVLEERCVPTQGAFLQGFAFVDANHNGRFDTGEGIANATIQLFAADSATLGNYPTATLSTVLGSATSDSTGYYIFTDSSITVPNTSGLASGNYLLVETPLAGFSNGRTQIHSQLDPASQVNSSTVRVTLEDPARLVDDFDSNGPGRNDTPFLDGTPEPGFSGQLNIHLTDSSPPPPLTSPEFFSLCMDLTQKVGGGVGFPVLPAPTSILFTNGGEIAYLYDHYGLTALDDAHAEALQEAEWTLIYGSRFTPDLTTNPGVSADYSFYLSDAAGKNETAIVLDAINSPAGRGQTMIVTGSLNFLNIASPSIATHATANITLGAAVPIISDVAVLSGGVAPTGTITFTLTFNGSPVQAATQTDTVAGNGAYAASFTLPTTGNVAGTYIWSSSYSGDSNNNPASETGSLENGEATVVSPAPPSIVTTASPANITLGTTSPTIHDTAVLSGGFVPTGTITFTLTFNGNPVPAATQTDTVAGNGAYAASFALPTSGNVAGTYIWSSSYSGDSNNDPATETGSLENGEATIVSPPPLMLSTIPGGTIAIGSGDRLTDSATLTGGVNPTGTITFTLKGPGGEIVDVETVTVHGDGTYSTPNGFLPTAIGTDEWQASYSGDANNPAVTSPFGAEAEVVTQGGTVVTLSKIDLLGSNFANSPDGNITENTVFVNSLYHNLLGQPPDQNGFDGAFLILEAGGSRFQLVQNIWRSGEHRDLEVEQLYVSILHRTASPAERAGWVNALLAGASETDVATAFLTSPEYLSTHSDSASFVTGLYHDVLGRTPGASEVAGWQQALSNGLSRSAVVQAFLNSDEYHKRIVDQFYIEFLDRAPDAAGEQGWVTFLRTGGTIETTAEMFLASDEYALVV
jgi:hypothetical protein